MTEQSIEPPNFKRLKISRNLGLSKYKSSNYDDDLIFHPADETSNPTLLIEVLNNKELKGVIPCASKNFMSLNIPVIGSKFKKENKYRCKEKDGIPIYELEGDFDPQTVCEFIKGMVTGDLDVSPSNAIKFCLLADFWNCDDIFALVKLFVDSSMENAMFVDAWNFGENFTDTCIKYVTNCTEFIDGSILKDITRMDFLKFKEFVDACQKIEVNSTEIMLTIVEWFKENPIDKRCQKLILAYDFSNVSDDNRMTIYIDISMHVVFSSEFEFLQELAATIFKDMKMNSRKLVEKKLLRSEGLKYRVFSNTMTYYNSKVQNEVNTKIFEMRTQDAKGIATSPALPQSVSEFTWKIETGDLNTLLDENRWSVSFGIVNADAQGVWRAPQNQNEEDQSVFGGYMLKVSHKKLLTKMWKENDYRKTSFNWKNCAVISKDYEHYESVEVKFHQEKRQLEFCVNGKSQGIAFMNIKEGDYRLCVEVEGRGTKLTICA